VQLCADGSFTAVSLTIRPQFTANLFTVAVGFIGTLCSSYSAPLKNLDRGSFTGGFERWMKEGSGKGASLCGSCMRGTWSEGSFIGKPEGYAK
jgi:hypothetical protein